MKQLTTTTICFWPNSRTFLQLQSQKAKTKLWQQNAWTKQWYKKCWTSLSARKSTTSLHMTGFQKVYHTKDLQVRAGNWQTGEA